MASQEEHVGIAAAELENPVTSWGIGFKNRPLCIPLIVIIELATKSESKKEKEKSGLESRKKGEVKLV